MTRTMFQRCLLLLLVLPAAVTARAILGVDLGSLYMKVALVQSGSPLEIVTNLHSKRKTEQMILFDREQRFYGADASALLARKSTKTPSSMSLLLGRDDQHPAVRVLSERHYPLTPSYNDTRTGTVLTVDGHDFTPEELVAMVLAHAVDISVAYAAEQGAPMATPPEDVVLTVPCFATQRERQALLDAAALAHLNVLTLMDETTAAALQYAMDKTFYDAESSTNQDQVLIFYNMGASALQVSLVHFTSQEIPQKYGKPKRVPALTVLAKAWDETLGGLAFDHLLVEHLADEFNALWRKQKSDDSLDIRTQPRAMMKLRIQANKVKHVLSANTDIPVHVEHDDVSLSTQVSRQLLEELAAPLLQRAVQPLVQVMERAQTSHKDFSWTNLTGLELIGGGMRIPRIQTELQAVLQEHCSVELGLHMNADESMALGAAFGGANISTAFRVRPVGMTDIAPFGMQVTLENVNDGKKKKDDEWHKQATLFQPWGKLNIKKTIAFSHDQNVACALDYTNDDLLPEGSEHGLAQYEITGVDEFAKEMAKKELGKPKVSLQFELSASGIASLIKAEAAVEETYTEQEEVEVDDEEAAAAAEKEKEEKKDDDESKQEDDAEGEDKKEEEAKPVEKPKKTILQDVEKKRIHKRTLEVKTTYVGRVQPHSEELMAASRAKLLEMAEKDKERMMLEASRNKVESYIYHIKNTINDKEDELKAISTDEQREECMNLALAAQDWMDDDGYSADYATMEEKYASLSTPFEKIMLRLKEKDARPAAITALNKKLTEVENLLVKWETSKPQITEEERNSVVEKVEEVRKWIEDQEKAQAAKEPNEEPAFLSADVPAQMKPVETLVMRLSKKPKPKPPKKEKKEENATDDSEKTKDEATEDGEEKKDEPVEGETAEEATTDETATEGEAEEKAAEDEL